MPLGLPPSLTSRASFARLGPRKGGGNALFSALFSVVVSLRDIHNGRGWTCRWVAAVANAPIRHKSLFAAAQTRVEMRVARLKADKQLNVKEFLIQACLSDMNIS